MTSSWLLLRRLFKDYVRQESAMLALGCMCMVVTAVTTAFLTTYLKPIFDDIFIGHRADLLWYTAGGVFCVFLVKGVSEYGSALCVEYVGQRMMIALQTRLFSHLIFLDFDFFQKHHGAQIVSLLTNDVRALRNSFLQSISNIAKEGVTVLSLLVVMLRENFLLSGIALIGFPLALLPFIYCGRRVRRLSGNVQQQVGDLQVFFHQTCQGIALIKASHTEHQEILSLQHRLSVFFKESLRTFRTRALVHPIMEILGGVAIVIVIIEGGLQVMASEKTTGSFLTFLTALFFVYRPAKNIVHFQTLLQEGLASADRVFSLYQHRVPPCLKEPCEEDKLLPKSTPPLLEFKNVSFSYPETQKQVLQNLSCTFPAGQRLAMIGPSGSGKTSILYLLLRFYQPQCGCILWNQTDISSFSLRYLRQNTAFVGQNILLFDDTVMNNIRYGCPEADDEKVYQAARLAHADCFIQSLPHRYETRVGENGARLSGGQRQRIALARAFLKEAPLLLLDEATSALDAESEHAVQEALATLTSRCTTLTIAHRFSTIEASDRIFVLSQGHIAENGTHAELLQKKGLYARLALLQELTGSDAC